jgi:hypothetical protein
MTAVVLRADRLLQRGPLGSVEYAIRANGAMEAREWLEKQRETTQAAFDQMFRVTVAHGRISNWEKFKQIRNEVHEFKRGPDRLFCFKLGGRWLLTHHKPKASLKNYNPDIDRAITIAAEHVAYEMKHNQ